MNNQQSTTKRPANDSSVVMAKQMATKTILTGLGGNTTHLTEASLPVNPFAMPSTLTTIVDPPTTVRLSVRERTFAVLHRPKRFECLYHVAVLLPVLFTCLVLNMLRPKSSFDDHFLAAHYDHLHLAMLVMDTLLCELLLRLWSSDYLEEYIGCSGKGLYLHDHFYRRALDIIGVVTFFGYLVFNTVCSDDRDLFANDATAYAFDITFRCAHVLQVIQVHRVVGKLIKPIQNAVRQQSNPLLLSLLCVVMMMMIGSVLLLITESNVSTMAYSIEGSLWLTFECFSTVGYGDSLIYSSQYNKLVISIVSVVGIYFFALPSFIIGNGLSIAVQEQRRMTFKYMSIAELIRTAITHQQITKQTVKYGSRKAKRTRLMNHHLESFSRLNLLKSKKYTRLDDEDEDQAREVEQLWNKLLYIKMPKSKEASSTNGTTPANVTLANGSLPKETDTGDIRTANTNRVVGYLGNMDLTRYSNDNSLLWFNIHLIEDDIDRLGELDLEIKLKLNSIRRVATDLRTLLHPSFTSKSSSKETTTMRT